MRHPVAQLLKQQTAVTHARVEGALDLLGEGLGPDRLRVVIGRFAGFWPGIEALVDSWAANNPMLAAELDWSRRRRSAQLVLDLGALGCTPAEVAALPIAPAPFAFADDAFVLGWLYVSEGSTLGGAVIDRALRARVDCAELNLNAFTPYSEGPGPMWRAYLDVLTAWVANDAERSDAVVRSAEHAFAALASWVAPIAVDVAA